MSAPSSTSRRERWIIGAALAGIAAVAWAYMIHEARAMDVTGVCQCLGMAMGGGAESRPQPNSFSAATTSRRVIRAGRHRRSSAL